MTTRWTALWQRLWSERPLRQKLALGVWLALVPILLGSSEIALREAHDQVARRLRQQLIWDAEHANGWLKLWDQQRGDLLSVVAEMHKTANLTAEQHTKVLAGIHQLFENYSFAITQQNGSTTIIKGKLLQPLQSSSILRTPAYANTPTAKALKGSGSSALLTPPLTAKPCLARSAPVYASTAGPKAVTAALTSCLPMEDLDETSGMDTLLKSLAEGGASLPILDLSEGKKQGYALMMVYNQGSTIVFGQDEDRDGKKQEAQLLDPQSGLRSAWAPLIELARKNKEKTAFNKIRIQGITYFVGVDRKEDGRSVLMVMDARSAFKNVDNLFRLIWVGNLLGLAMSSLFIYRICSALSEPIDRAGAALSRISSGDFGDPLPTDKSDVGRLYGYVNNTSKQLKAYLEDARKHASTDAQLEAARRIQADFLIRDLPQQKGVELAASCDPAYEIGADWYDALEIDGFIFVVVADVCDKGIPSALYMSVFRSLLRHNLATKWFLTDKDPAETISRAISSVNAYMAETHGDTGMFATTFAAAYDPRDGKLHYIVAGHEAPLILHNEQQLQLTLGGPAVGIFSSANFEVHHCELQPGDLLLAFSDGLPDARDPDGNAFGHARIQTILSEKRSEDWHAQALLNDFKDAVTRHIQTADQFDDLTLLSLKVQN